MRPALLASASALLAIPSIAVAQGVPSTPPPTNPATAGPSNQPGPNGEPAGISASADQGTQGGIQDIVVTAQRREERAQNVPIAISAFSAQQLAAQGVGNTLQLANFIPNLFAMNNTGLGSANAYYLRGLGNTESIATFDPPVGTYVDDVYISRQNANNLSLFDVERVEVLRGPQGTLFGRNTTGGAINVILRKPGDEFGGFAEAGYGRFNRKLLRGSVDVPLSPTFFAKVSGYWQDGKGYVRNVTTGERINDDDGWGARLGLRGELSSNVRWNASYAHIVGKGENILNFTCNPKDPTDCSGRFASTGLTQGNAPGKLNAGLIGGPIKGQKANFGLGNNTATELITSNLEVGLSDNLTLNLITGFVSLRQKFALDFADGRIPALPNLAVPSQPVAGQPTGSFTITNDGYHQQFSQEAKLSGSLFDGFVNFVGGGFYLAEWNRTDFADIFGIAPKLDLLLGDRVLKNTVSAVAGYAQADLNLTQQIKVTAGIRYTDEIKKFNIRDQRSSCQVATPAATCLFNQFMIAPSGVRIPTRLEAKVWTPRFAVNFRPSEQVLFYASATRGFKSGGWNARGYVPSQLLPFSPEKVWSYEAGIKSDLFNRTVRANLTVYQENVTDLQTPSAIVAQNGTATFITRNFANYRNRGVEGELTWQPVPELNLFANIGYQRDKYRLKKNAPDVDIYGIQSVAAQQRACKAQLAAGQIPGGPGPAPGQTAFNAPSCGAGIVDARGNIAEPVRTPDWTISFGGSYSIPLGGNGMTLVPSANAHWQSKSETGTANLSFFTGSITDGRGTVFPVNPYGGNFVEGSLSPANWLVNASLTLNGPDKRWSLSAECTNCFNEVVNQSSLVNLTYINEPVMWRVRARYNF